MENKKFIALVPMKGNSVRLPNKNLKTFNGRPLYHCIINCLLECPKIKEVCVNTDSVQIKDDVRNNFNSVRIIDRPESIQGDFISMNDIIAYDLSVIEGNYFLQTHSTNPLIKPTTISNAINRFENSLNTYDTLFSVTKLQTRLYWKDGNPINHKYGELLRTQDLPAVYEENSNFYIFTRNSFYSANNQRIGLRPEMFEVNKLEAIDIDEPEDFELAELLYKHRLNKKSP